MGMSRVVSLHRYPVKSMMGEELNATEVDEFGLLGDRAYAIVGSSDGKVASAKNLRKWPCSTFRPHLRNPRSLVPKFRRSASLYRMAPSSQVINAKSAKFCRARSLAP